MIRPTIVVVFDSIRDEMSVVTPVRPGPATSAAVAWEHACERIEAIVATLEGPLHHDSVADPHLLARASRSNTAEADFLAMVERAPRVCPRGRHFPGRSQPAVRRAGSNCPHSHCIALCAA